MKKYKNKIHFWGLSRNPNKEIIEFIGIDILNNPIFTRSEFIFEYDYEKMKDVTNIFKEELIAYVFHPSRLFKNVTEETDIDELLDMYE